MHDDALDAPAAAGNRAAPRRIRRGDVYWARIARADLDEEAAADAAPDRGGTADAARAIAHPHVVLQDDLLNQSRLPTVVVCALTSNLKRQSEPGNVLLEAGEANLPRASVVVVSQVASIAKAELGEHIGALSAARVEQIFDGMRLQQAFFR